MSSSRCVRFLARPRFHAVARNKQTFETPSSDSHERNRGRAIARGVSLTSPKISANRYYEREEDRFDPFNAREKLYHPREFAND